MDMDIDIAAMSMSLASNQLQRNVGMAVVKKAMETNEVAVEGLYKMIEEVGQAMPTGNIIDVKA